MRSARLLPLAVLSAGDTVIVDLNPGYADNNVILVGVLRSGHLDGTWQWDTVSGPSTQGGFSASLE